MGRGMKIIANFQGLKTELAIWETKAGRITTILKSSLEVISGNDFSGWHWDVSGWLSGS